MSTDQLNQSNEPEQCFWLRPYAYEDGNFYPSIVKVNEAGHHKTDWNYGSDMALAQEAVNKLNMERYGLTPLDAERIVDSSMRLQEELKNPLVSLRFKNAFSLWQTLRALQKAYHVRDVSIAEMADILDTDEDCLDTRLDELLDALRESMLDHLDDCGQCGAHHRPDFSGDCRNDLERV